jgi:hypothetical protein
MNSYVEDIRETAVTVHVQEISSFYKAKIVYHIYKTAPLDTTLSQ